MKKQFITLAAALFILGASPLTPVRAASYPTTIVSGTALEASTVVNAELSTAVSATTVHATKVQKTQKSFFAKLKSFFTSGKSQVVALILVLLVGGLGIHRFYLGYTWQGVVQLLTLGGLGIWSLIDLIRIITGDLQPKDGSYDQTF
ncbi:MAG: TM2 domain-containing protein [Sphingobacteriales bacterium]|nr:MAG: TM2 domain-containing protein [Sphingobacteriales bacterium]